MSINNSKRIKEMLLTNLESQNEEDIVLNLVQLYFDFKNKEINIMYYLVDNNYPDSKIKFSELKEIMDMK